MMRLRVDAFPTGPDWAHFTLVEATGTGSSEIVRPVGGQYAPTVPGIFWGVGADGGPTGDLTSASLADQQRTVARALDLGAGHVDVGQRPEEGHVMLADPDGNEFGVPTPR
jgi:hypothetical protein